MPLNEDEVVGAIKAPHPPSQLDDNIGGTDKTPLQDHASEVVAELGNGASEEGLSLFMKLGLAGVIVAACYGFVRAHSPRSSRVAAGRHGAYEKTGV